MMRETGGEGGLTYGTVSEGINWEQLLHMQKRRGEGTGFNVAKMGVEHKRADCQGKTWTCGNCIGPSYVKRTWIDRD